MEHGTSLGVTAGEEPEERPPTLPELLAEWARGRGPGDRAAVGALVADGELVVRDQVRLALVAKENGLLGCDWERLSRRYCLISELTESDAVFLVFVLALARRSPVPLSRVGDLGERRLVIVLRALAALAGSQTVAVGMRT
ncbi:hypothetical protein ACFWIA_26755 [Streptomyces sp. NPDC127068]|uniref:hypothetical protein n=1 Tax=Streptomyces sp. NPDC127068 TaxID=3347127 RepID=UPI003653986B